MTADGSELPRAPYNHEGGLAVFIRAQTPIPPSTHATASTHGVGLVLANGSVFSTLTTPYNAHSNPALQGGKEYENRSDPKKRPGDKPSARQRIHDKPPLPPTPSQIPAPPPVPTQAPSQVPQPPPVPAVSRPPLQPPVQTVPEPPHPINRKDGWKQSQPKSKGKMLEPEEDSNVEMKETQLS